MFTRALMLHVWCFNVTRVNVLRMFPVEEHSTNIQRTHLTMSRAYASDQLLQLITNCVQDLKLFCTIGGQS